MTDNTLLQRAQANFSRGNKSKEQGKIAESIQSYWQAVEIKPDFIKPFHELAKIYESQENFTETVKCYRRIISFNPADYSAYLKLAEALQKQHKIYGAIAAYQEAIELKPDLNLRIYIKLANLIIQEKSIDEREWIESQSNLNQIYTKLPSVVENIKNKKYFDAYIPLGDNCEAGMQFWRIGYNESSFFRFTASRFNATYNILNNNFNNAFNRDYIVPRSHCNEMVLNTKYNITFHSKLKSEMDRETREQKFLSNYDFDTVFQNETSKINHLIAKWNCMMQSDRHILFILKNDEQDRYLTEKNVQKISDLFLARYTNHNFKILCIQLDKFKEPEWQNPYLVNRYFSYFPARGSRIGKNADKTAWNRIFDEFPLSLG